MSQPKRTVALDVSALDSSFKEHSTRGIGRYAKELTQELASHHAAHPQLSFTHFDHTELNQSKSLADRLINQMPYGRQTLKQQVLYPLRLNQKKFADCDLLHFLAQTDGPSWCRKPYALTVMDLIPLVCRDLYPAANLDWRFKLARRLELMTIKNASLILTISECSKKDIVELLNINPDRIFVTPLASRLVSRSAGETTDPTAVAKQLGINPEQPFFFYVGGIDPRKNISGLLKAFAHYRAETRGAAPAKLYIAGRINLDKQYQGYRKELEALGLQEEVCELGFITDAQLVSLYQSCLALCFLSLYEGFGLTPLEAASAGAPVITAELSAIPEVLGDAALYVDPENAAEVAAAMASIEQNSDLRAQLRAAGIDRATQFSWSKTAAATVAAYQTYFSRANLQ